MNVDEHPRTINSIGARRMIMWHLGKWDAPIYCALVAVGVPLMSAFFHDFTQKLWIGFFFMALTPFYWWIELGEIKSQIAINGLLEPREINSQRKSMQLLYWGVAAAFVIWCLGIVGQWKYPAYGFMEWFILGHTLVVAWTTISVIYPLMDEYLQATSSQRRFEEH